MTTTGKKTRLELENEITALKARNTALEMAGSGDCVEEVTRLRRENDAFALATAIVENSPAVLFRRRSDQSQELVYVTENLSQWGYRAEDFLSGRVSFEDVVYPEDHDRVRAEIEHYEELGKMKYAQEYRIITADGEVRWVSDVTSVTRDENGTPIYNEGVLLDITRRKEMEEALTASEFKFRRTIEGSGQGYLLLDENLIIREVNEAYCRMIGYEARDLLGKRPHDFATLEYQRYMETNKARFEKEDQRRFEGSMVHRDGHVVPVLINANTLRDSQGETLGNVAFVTDLTEQKKALELAGEVQKSLLPSEAPQIAGLDVAGYSLPSQVAGGDYFDYLLEPDDSGALSVVVGDISGHGVDAALLMSSARGFLRMRAAHPGSPVQIVKEMNSHLAEDLDGTGRFMTLFYLRLAPGDNSVRWVRAGHDPAMIYCPKLDFFTELGDDPGLPLGVTRDAAYEERTNELHPGQIIAVGTDGIWEARNLEGEMFGKERFKRVVRRFADKSARTILDGVFDALRVFTGGARPDDDITLVVVKYEE